MSETPNQDDGVIRRDFLAYTALGMGAISVGSVLWPVIDSMNPARDVLALASVEIDVAAIAEGQSITVKWRGKPVFVRHRTAEEIAAAEKVNLADLPDPQTDASRVEKPQWLVMVGICTHLGCVPVGQKSADVKGDYDGWFCPCHGSHYDTSGRIRKGPAPRNLEVPPYQFVNDTLIKVG